MKLKNQLSVLGLLLIAFSYAEIAAAHHYSQALGKSTSTALATDRFSIVCNGREYTRIYFQVRDNRTTPEKVTKVRMRGAKTLAGLASAPWLTDTNDSDGSLSRQSMVFGGVGTFNYYFEVQKTAVAGVVGPETYTVRILCSDDGGNLNPDDQYFGIWYLNQ